MRTVCPFFLSSWAKRLQVAVVPLVSRFEHSNTNKIFMVFVILALRAWTTIDAANWAGKRRILFLFIGEATIEVK